MGAARPTVAFAAVSSSRRAVFLLDAFSANVFEGAPRRGLVCFTRHGVQRGAHPPGRAVGAERLNEKGRVPDPALFDETGNGTLARRDQSPYGTQFFACARFA